MNMKWLDNLIKIATDHKAGNCPHCGSSDTDYGFVVVLKEEKMGYGAIWCNNCHRGFHISRTKILPYMPIIIIPNNIDFSQWSECYGTSLPGLRERRPCSISFLS